MRKQTDEEKKEILDDITLDIKRENMTFGFRSIINKILK